MANKHSKWLVYRTQWAQYHKSGQNNSLFLHIQEFFSKEQQVRHEAFQLEWILQSLQKNTRLHKNQDELYVSYQDYGCKALSLEEELCR